jgi:E3 ubiquitin-protein ligase HUWE1
VLRVFDETELELLICGLPHIDVDELQAHTDYSGYTPASQQARAPRARARCSCARRSPLRSPPARASRARAPAALPLVPMSLARARRQVRWFWEVVREMDSQERARLIQFVTGTSKIPLEGFSALRGMNGPQRFQIHRAHGGPERLPSAHTCFNQLDIPKYTSREQLRERLLLACREGHDGFGFG